MPTTAKLTVPMGAQTAVQQPWHVQAPLAPVSTEGLKGRLAMNGLLKQQPAPNQYNIPGGRGGVSARGALAEASGQMGAGSVRPRLSSSADMRQRMVEAKPGGFLSRFTRGGARHTADAVAPVGARAAAAAKPSMFSGLGNGVGKALGALKWPLGIAGAYGAYKLLSAPSEHQQFMQSGGLPYVQM